jgi:hypothetical protein
MAHGTELWMTNPIVVVVVVVVAACRGYKQNVMVGEWIVYIASIMSTMTSKTTQELHFV